MSDMMLQYLACVFLVALFSVILHELAHGLTAYALGDETARLSGRLTLNPFKHIDPFMSIILPLILALMHAPVFGGAKPVPINTRNLKYGEWGFALVALAGPFMNILIAFIAFVLAGIFAIPITADIYTSTPLSQVFLSTVIFLNLGFAVFNLLPLPPLDGSRLLRALAPDNVRDFLTLFERYGVFIIYILICLSGSLLSRYMISATTGILNLFKAITPF